MAFILSTTPAYWWPVKLSFPTDDGNLATSAFDARFKRLPQAEHDELLRSLVERDTDGNETPETVAARRVMAGWRKVLDENGQAIEFSVDTFEQMLAIQGVSNALVKAYLDSIRKASEKN